MSNAVCRTLLLACAMPALLTACGQDTAPPDEGTDRRSIGQQIGEGYLDNLREAEAARSAAEDRARRHEALDALSRDTQPTE